MQAIKISLRDCYFFKLKTMNIYVCCGDADMDYHRRQSNRVLVNANSPLEADELYKKQYPERRWTIWPYLADEQDLKKYPIIEIQAKYNINKL